jgi:uncharacterized protein (DUF1778 family)
MSKPLISFRPKAETLDAIKVAAKQDRRTVSQFLANLVEDAMHGARAADGSQSASAPGATLR